MNTPLHFIDKLDITSIYIDKSSTVYWFENIFGILGRPVLFVDLLQEQL